MGMYTKYLVCYDVSDNKRRRKLFEALKNLGLVAMQESVFYGDLKNADINSLRRTVMSLLKEDEDKCFWFPCFLKVQDIKNCFGYKNWTYTEPDGYGVI